MLDVTIFNPTSVIFKGQAKSVIFPGEMGVFEVQPFHKEMMSRLIKGHINVDGKMFPIFRGIVRVNKDQVVVVLEQE